NRDDANVEKQTREDIVVSQLGGTTIYEETRRIKREITFTLKAGIAAEIGSEQEVSLRAALVGGRASLSQKIQAHFEGALGETWSDEIAKTARHEIPLKKGEKARVVWYEIYRTGTVEVTQNGRTFTVPFQFPVATKTVIEQLK